MADLAPVHEQIFGQLNTALITAGAAPLYDGKVPQGAEIPMLSPAGQVKPHCVLWLGDDEPHPDGMGIDGPADALGILPFVVLCVAASYRDLTKLRDVVHRALVGYTPEDCGVIVNDGARADQPVPTLLTPQRYTRALGFWLSVGAAGAPV